MASVRIDRRCAWAVLLAAGVATLPALVAGADDKADKLPPDLAQVPGNALGFVQVRVADLLAGELGRRLQKQLAKEAAAGREAAVKALGVTPEEVERAVVILTNVNVDAPLAVITTAQPYDRDKVLAAVVPEPQEHKVKGVAYYTSKKAGRAGLRFVNERTFVAGPVEDLVQQIVRPAAAPNPLVPALRLAAEKHLIAGGVQVPQAVAAELKAQLDRQPNDGRFETFFEKSFRPLLEVQTAAAAIDLGRDAELTVRFMFPSDDAAKEALWPARDGLAMFRLALGALTQQAGRQKDMAPFVPLFRQAQLALRTATVEQQQTALRGSLRLSADPAVVVKMVPAVAAAIVKMQESAGRAQSMNNLKQIALAMHNYHDTYGSFPPHALMSKNGKPLLSWRVAILPFIEQDALYKQFHLDEPWDSAYNKNLLQQMPRIYASPTDLRELDRAGANVKVPALTVTVYQGFHGKDAFFEGKKGTSIATITDGTSNTIMVVEAAPSVPWTKPEDLPFEAGKPLPPLGGVVPGGFNAAFCDGSVHFIKKSISQDVLRYLITRNGGEVINSNDF